MSINKLFTDKNGDLVAETVTVPLFSCDYYQMLQTNLKQDLNQFLLANNAMINLLFKLDNVIEVRDFDMQPCPDIVRYLKLYKNGDLTRNEVRLLLTRFSTLQRIKTDKVIVYSNGCIKFNDEHDFEHVFEIINQFWNGLGYKN